MIANRQDTYREYRARINAREVLARYGARNCTEMTNKDGTTEIVHSCLIDRVEPHHANGDAHPSAWCNVEKNLYVCSAYWSGDLVRLVQKLEGKETLEETLPIVGEMLSGATKGVVEFQEVLQRIFDSHNADSAAINTYAPRVLNRWAVSHPYMYDERAVNHETLKSLHVGFDPDLNRIVIPHFWRGQLVGWQKRLIPERPGRWPGTVEETWIKYKSSSGFPKSETLYLYDQALLCASGMALVVESPFSCIKAWDLGLRNPSPVATFGAEIGADQIDLLSEFKAVTVWFDADVAGYKGTRHLVEGLMRRTHVMVVIPQPGIDLGDYSDIDAVYATLESAMPAVLWLAEVEKMERASGS